MGISAVLFALDFIILRWMWQNCKQARNLRGKIVIDKVNNSKNI